jgi:hypothetical protein
MANLQLSLKTKWFNLTKEGIKTEDYREINEYWVKRFFYHKESKLTTEEIKRYFNHFEYYGYVEPKAVLTYHDLSLKPFDFNIMTLGYPKSTDTSRIIKLEHKGIEIGFGKEEWGAEPNKLYFVIKHGKLI